MLKNPIIDWIPIDADRPHINEHVLVVCVNLKNHMERHVSKAQYWGERNGHHLWSGHKHVTHWYPLPELPVDISLTNPKRS